MSIEGKSPADLSHAELAHIFAQAPGTSVSVTYNRQGKEASTVLVLKEVLP